MRALIGQNPMVYCADKLISIPITATTFGTDNYITENKP